MLNYNLEKQALGPTWAQYFLFVREIEPDQDAALVSEFEALAIRKGDDAWGHPYPTNLYIFTALINADIPARISAALEE